MLPKKSTWDLVKLKNNHISLVISPVLKAPIFFQVRDGPFFPTLKFLHLAGDFMPMVRVDKGGIKFILKGADVFCTGLTSAGGLLPEDLPAESPVQICAEGKTLPLAIGVMKLSVQDIKSINSGVGVETLHHLNDDLWRAKSIN